MDAAPRFKFRELIAALGGVQAIGPKLAECGFSPPPQETIWGWKRRDSVPGNWALALLLLAEREGVLPEISKLRRDA